jgi:hypothetical protein
MRIKVPPARRTGDRDKALAPRTRRFASCKNRNLRILTELSKTGCSDANMSQYEGNLTSRSFLIADQKRICAVVWGWAV